MISLKSFIEGFIDKPGTSNLNKLIDNVLTDTDRLVSNLKALKVLINKESLSSHDKNQLKIILSNYKRYFNRDNGGTPEVVRGIQLQSEVEKLIK